jgi:hypothetical protein
MLLVLSTPTSSATTAVAILVLLHIALIGDSALVHGIFILIEQIGWGIITNPKRRIFVGESDVECVQSVRRQEEKVEVK